MTAEKKKVDFTQGRIFSKLLLFVLPIVATNLLQVFYNAADMMAVSLSSEVNAVGAIGTTTSFLHLIVNVFIGFSVGANVIVAKYIGAKDRERTQKAVHTSLIMALIFGVFAMTVGILVSRPILQAMGNTGSLLALAVKYTKIYFLGVPFLALTNYLIAIFRAKGDAKTPLIVLSIAGLINVGLNLFLVLCFNLSVEGVGIATAVANIFSFIVLLVKLRRDKDYTTFSFKNLKMQGKSFVEIVKVGLPAAIQSALFSLSNMLIQSSIIKVNNKACPVGSDYQPIVNGSAAAGTIENFVYTAMNAVYQGAITFTSQNVGARRIDRVKPIMYNCFLLTSIIGITLGSLAMLCKTPLLALYGIKAGEAGSLDALAMQAAKIRLKFVCIPYFLAGIMEVCTGVLRGLGKSLTSMAIALIGACLLRVVWLLTVFPLKESLEMIFICYPITWIVTTIAGFVVIQILLKRMLKERE